MSGPSNPVPIRLSELVQSTPSQPVAPSVLPVLQCTPFVESQSAPLCDLFDNEDLRVFPDHEEIASPIQLRSADTTSEHLEADDLLEAAAQRDGGNLPAVPASPESSGSSGYSGSANKMPRKVAPPPPPLDTTAAPIAQWLSPAHPQPPATG